MYRGLASMGLGFNFDNSSATRSNAPSHGHRAGTSNRTHRAFAGTRLDSNASFFRDNAARRVDLDDDGYPRSSFIAAVHGNRAGPSNRRHNALIGTRLDSNAGHVSNDAAMLAGVSGIGEAEIGQVGHGLHYGAFSSMFHSRTPRVIWSEARNGAISETQVMHHSPKVRKRSNRK